ncbi:MAG: DUF2800 domain-containing protein [Clostridium sp.]|uniref:DUF2800 domain-containing protein n=1 Tax=Clostridium sp. TaxID=1506 RepID=UPI00290ACBC4|nr:DUF2800 domain-containing protein [Clostridium sp.]MDU4939059.1 DUF2800 domain-containing protein [Clostridium sp.]
MAKHAILSASGASRWMACTPSAVLEQQFENKSSVFAEEGTLAHELGELTLKLNLGEITKRTFNSKFKKIQENKLYSADMPDYVQTYVDTCLERVSEAKATTPDALFKIEQRLDFSEWVPDGFGTGDFVIIADGTMEVCDLKYGKGVPVSANNNKQMMLYALGAIAEFNFLYDIQKVRMTIIQPRLDNISTFEVTTEDLLKWAEDYVRPRAELAIKGKGEFCAGDHCKFCRAKAVCRARAEKNMELAKYDFEEPALLDNNDVAYILSKIDELVNWAGDVKDFALEQALNGEEYDGFKVVEGRSNRKYADTEAIVEILRDNNFNDPDIFKPSELITLTNMEKLVGKKKLTELIGDYIVKPPGKPTLVPITDKREPYNPAKADFME